jgi:excisionase family DNA binding protein
MGLTHGLSRMTGNCHVRFLGEGAAAMSLPYPTEWMGSGERRLDRRSSGGRAEHPSRQENSRSLKRERRGPVPPIRSRVIERSFERAARFCSLVRTTRGTCESGTRTILTGQTSVGSRLVYPYVLDNHDQAGSTKPPLIERWLSVDELAVYLGIKRDTIYKWIVRRRMPAHKVGRLWKFQREEVDRWVKSGAARDAEP